MTLKTSVTIRITSDTKIGRTWILLPKRKSAHRLPRDSGTSLKKIIRHSFFSKSQKRVFSLGFEKSHSFGCAVGVGSEVVIVAAGGVAVAYSG